jgi:hypothetical protein
MLTPAQHVAMPGGSICKQGNVLEIARERVGFASLAIAMIWSSFVSALAGRIREGQLLPHGSSPSWTDREAWESRQPRSSLRYGGNSKDGEAMPARACIPQPLGMTHPDGPHRKTNRSNTNYVIITIFPRKFIGPSSSASPPSRPGWSGAGSRRGPGPASGQISIRRTGSSSPRTSRATGIA